MTLLNVDICLGSCLQISFFRSISGTKIFFKKIVTRRKSLHDFYDVLMEEILGQETYRRNLARDTLSFIIHSRIGPTIAEILHAFSTKRNIPRLGKDNLPDIGDIILSCAGIVFVDRQTGTVCLIHQSIRQYLESTWMEWFSDAHGCPV